MARKKHQKNNDSNNLDLAFTFTGCKFNVAFEPETVPEDIQTQIKDDLAHMAQTIWIDKSYVQCKDNKHDDVFLLLEGWDSLIALLNDTNYGDDATEEQYDVIVDFYYTMALGYMYNILNTLYPKYASHVYIEASAKSNMAVDIVVDTCNEWKTYPGKWQTWNE